MTLYCSQKRGNGSHQQRLEAIVSLIGVDQADVLKERINLLLSPTPNVSPELYERYEQENCTPGTCFLMEHVPLLLSKIVSIAQEEIAGSLKYFSKEDIRQKREQFVQEYIEAIARIGGYYDVANSICAENTTAGDKTRNKFDLFRVAEQHKGAVKALVDPQTEFVSQLFIEHAPFLAKIYLSALAHDYESRDILSHLEPARKSLETQTRELERLVDATGIKVQYSKRFRTWRSDDEFRDPAYAQQEADAILESQVEVLKNYAMLGYLRLGAIYIRPIRGSLSDVPVQKKKKGVSFSQEDMHLIYEEMSNLSRALLRTAYSISKSYLDRLYGTPATDFCIMLGGANARKEFPSFDYDGFSVYGVEGNTQGGILKGISHKEYFDMLFKKVMEISNSMGHHFDLNFHEIIMWSNYEIKKGIPPFVVQTFEYLESRLTQSDTASLGSALNCLAVGVGSEDLGTKVQALARNFCKSDIEGQLAWIYGKLLIRRDEQRKKGLNIKYSYGGLRDINQVTWMSHIAQGINEHNVLKGINNLPITKRKKDALKESYLFLINTRIRMDFYFGRNDKDVPINTGDFAKALGYSGNDLGRFFQKDLKRHMVRVGKIVDGAIEKVKAMYPGIDEKLKVIRLENARANERLTQESEDKAALRAESIERKIGEDTDAILRRGVNPWTASLWAERASSEHGEDIL